MKLEPIEVLIKNFDNYSKKEEEFYKELELIQKTIINQNNKMNNLDIDEINNRINNASEEEKKKYEKILEEKRKYDFYKDKIEDIASKNYDKYKEPKQVNKSIKKRPLAIGISLGAAAVVAIGTLTILAVNKNNRIDNYVENGTTEYRTEEQTFSTTEAITETTTEKETEETTETTTLSDSESFENDYISAETIDTATEVIKKMNDGIDTLENTFLDEDKKEQAKEDAKDKVIEYTDFIFYGKEIDGKTFDELTDEEKEKVYTKYQKLINTINDYDPEYINNMSEKYKVVKEFGSLTLNNAKNKIKEKVGEEYYNSASEAGEAIKEGAKDTGSLALEYIKKKYENWRDNNDDE